MGTRLAVNYRRQEALSFRLPCESIGRFTVVVLQHWRHASGTLEALLLDQEVLFFDDCGFVSLHLPA
jgi:hypothetical protein